MVDSEPAKKVSFLGNSYLGFETGRLKTKEIRMNGKLRILAIEKQSCRRELKISVPIQLERPITNMYRSL